MPNTKTQSPPSLRTLKRRGVDLIQWYQSVEQSKTEILKTLAEVVVDIRSQFQDESGITDWRGNTWEYRRFMEDLYEKAGIPPDSKSTIQAALRYHVGNVLRSRVPRKELEAADLLATSPRERMASQRSEASAVLRALGTHTSDPASIRTYWRNATHAMESMSQRLAKLEVKNLPKREATAMARELDETIQHLNEVKATLAKRLGG